MSLIKVGLLFLYSSMKKNQKDSVIFYIEKWPLKSELHYFWPPKPKRIKDLEFCYTTQRNGAEAKFIHL